MKTKTMNNHIFEWGHERPYNSYANYIKQEFGGRIQKISLHAGLTCPNRDGSIGVGGCSFCNNDAFITEYCSPHKPISQQIIEGKLFVQRRYKKAQKYFAYFQAYSNTYTSIENLRVLFKEVQKFPEIIGFIIGTRPDCIDEQKLEFFAQLRKHYYLVLEYGVESIYDSTLLAINRGHTYEVSKNAIQMTADYGIHVGAHIIVGLPGETQEMIMAEAFELSQLPLHSLKLHQLQIVAGTRFAQEYEQNPHKFQLFSPELYIPFIAEFVSKLSPTIKIERLAGDSPIRVRIAPVWQGVKYESFVQKFEEYMFAHNLWQGKHYVQKNIM